MADLRTSILEADDLESEVVTVDQWGVDVVVKSPDARQRARLMRDFMNAETGEVDYERMYPAIVIATVHDPETGATVFESSDFEMLAGKNGAAMETVARVAMRLAGFTADDAVDEGKADSD